MSTSKQARQSRQFLYSLFIALAFAGGIGLAFGLQQWRSAENVPDSGVSAYGGDFTLETVNGSAGLSDYQGKLVMIYFGFASCPDVCPTSLGIMKKAYNTLTQNEQNKVSGLFISIDPKRDTPEIAQNYARHFQPGFDGMSGTPEGITKVAQQYGVLFREMETPGSAMGYTLDHSSVIYLVDQQGVLQEKIQHGVTPKELTEKLRQYL
ncbi:MAG: SCO family protein [Thiolinea sp.]